MKTVYKGEPAKGLDFYNLLFESTDFNVELGKVALAAGKLEAEIILFLRRNGNTEKIGQLTLGGLIGVCRRHDLFDKNFIIVLEGLRDQRNYLAHNLYALHIDLIDETIMEKNNLLDTDIILYTERAGQLHENLRQLADLIRDKY